MKSLNALDALIQALLNDETVKTFKTLEQKLLSHDDYKTLYEKLTTKQKRMVQAAHYKSKDYAEKKQEYDDLLNTIEQDPFISQYLDLQSQINDDLQLIIRLIEDEINN